MHRRGIRHNQQVGEETDQRHRSEIGKRVVIERGKEVAIDRQSGRGDVDGVAVRGGAGDEFRGDVAAGARLVLDHHLLGPHFGEPHAEDTADPVDAAAGRERHDEFHEAVGPTWRRSLRGHGAAEGEDGRCRRQGEEPAPVDHGGYRVRSHSSTLIFASRMIGPHLSISDLRKAASSCGVEPTSVAPSRSSRSFTIEWPSAAATSALIFLMMAGGVLAGTKKANQVETSKPGTPASAMVGRSGAAGTRFAAVTANPRAAPFLTWGKLAVMLSKMRSRRPAMTSCNAGAAPR